MHPTTTAILERLREAPDFLSGEALCTDLSISRTAVSKHVRHLREMGYDIESVTRRGHRLQALPDVPYESEVAPLLTTDAIGRNVVFLKEAASTNTFLMNQSDDATPHGTVAVTESQTAGRGRLDHQWFSPTARNLTFSIALCPDRPPHVAAQLPLVAAVALFRSIRNLFPDIACGVKWPNDILVNRRKLAGILCEMNADMDRIRRVVVGIGININMKRSDFPSALHDTATSIEIETGATTRRVPLLAEVLNQMEQCYATWLDGELAALLPELQDASILTGRAVTIQLPNGARSGTVVRIEADGTLRLKKPNGSEEAIPSGEVHIEEF